jgi:hypothetical protein
MMCRLSLIDRVVVVHVNVVRWIVKIQQFVRVSIGVEKPRLFW